MKTLTLLIFTWLFAMFSSSQAALQVSLPLNDDPPPVVFNHLYVVVSEETFELIRDSPYFRDTFAAMDSGFPKFEEVNEDSQAIYLRGEQTYLEIFGPNNKFGEPVGKVGFGFSVERVGGLDWVEQQLKTQLNTEFERMLHRWDFETETPTHWYHTVYRKFPADSKTVWWFSEYHTDFFPALFPNRPIERSDIMRRTFLADRYDSTKELKNLLACVLVIDPAEATSLIADLTCLGFQTKIREDDGIDLIGPDFVLRLVSADAGTPAGLRAIQFEPNHQADQAVKMKFLDHLTIRRTGSNPCWMDLLPK